MTLIVNFRRWRPLVLLARSQKDRNMRSQPSSSPCNLLVIYQKVVLLSWKPGSSLSMILIYKSSGSSTMLLFRFLVIFLFLTEKIQESNWIATNNDFGCVSLRIAPVHARHTGVYSCKAFNEHGAAVTSASLAVQGTDGLLLDTSHPISLQKIQELESIDKYARLEAPDREFEKPQWIQPFENVDDVGEGQVVELRGLVEPSGDPNLRIEWLMNGHPLMNSNRHRQEHEFGNVILTIVHVLPHDSGVYTCRAYNLQGEATTSATVKILGYERLLLDVQHPSSWQRIQELEAPRIVEEIEEEIIKEKPSFITQLENVEDVPEGHPIHLEATFQPARDSGLKV